MERPPEANGTNERYGDQHYAQIVSLAADAIICIDRGHRITLFNKGAEQTFGEQ